MQLTGLDKQDKASDSSSRGREIEGKDSHPSLEIHHKQVLHSRKGCINEMNYEEGMKESKKMNKRSSSSPTSTSSQSSSPSSSEAFLPRPSGEVVNIGAVLSTPAQFDFLEKVCFFSQSFTHEWYQVKHASDQEGKDCIAICYSHSSFHYSLVPVSQSLSPFFSSSSSLSISNSFSGLSFE
jgi:hypothetical protein